MPVYVDVSSLNRFAGRVAKGPAVMKVAAEKVVENTAERVKQSAKDRAPELTGNLRDSIDAIIDGLEALVYTDLRYAPFVEYGTAQHGAAQPFMAPAVDSQRRKYPARMEQLTISVTKQILG